MVLQDPNSSAYHETEILSFELSEGVQFLKSLKSRSLLYPHEFVHLKRLVSAWIADTDNPESVVPYVYREIIVIKRGQVAEMIIRRDPMKYDRITQLPLKYELHEWLEGKYAEAEDIEVSLYIIELDSFSNINDTAGHHAGDFILYTLAERLNGLELGNKFVARLYGDEFAVAVVHGGETLNKQDCLDAIISTFALSIHVANEDFFITPSIGISQSPHHVDNPVDLLKCAYVALNQAKKDSTNISRVYEPTFTKKLKEQVELESDLKETLLKGEGLEVWYQPKIWLKDDSVAGLEALVRWRHPENGLIPPGVFIPIAERTSLICGITDCVIDNVCRDLPRIRAMGMTGRISINLSAKDFLRPEIVNDVCQILNKHHTQPADIELEITEGAFIADFSVCIDIISQFRVKGFTVSIDDFGTGYSSLSYLRKLPIDVLKVDMSFVRDIEHDESARDIYRALLLIASALKLKVVAEGVDSQGQKAILKDLNCDIIQGYLLSKPMPPADLKNYLN